MVSELNSDKLNISLSRVNFCSKGLHVHRSVWILTVLTKCVAHVLPNLPSLAVSLKKLVWGHFVILHSSCSLPENQLSCLPAPRGRLGSSEGNRCWEFSHSLLPGVARGARGQWGEFMGRMSLWIFCLVMGLLSASQPQLPPQPAPSGQTAAFRIFLLCSRLGRGDTKVGGGRKLSGCPGKKC